MEKGYSICHASVKVTQTEYHTTAIHPGLLEDRCSACFTFYTTNSPMILVSSMDTEPSAIYGTVVGCGGGEMS